MKTIAYLFRNYIAPLFHFSPLTMLFSMLLCITCFFVEPSTWREAAAWFCCFLADLLALIYQRRCERLEQSRGTHVRFLNGSNRSVPSVPSCKNPIS